MGVPRILMPTALCPPFFSHACHTSPPRLPPPSALLPLRQQHHHQSKSTFTWPNPTAIFLLCLALTLGAAAWASATLWYSYHCLKPSQIQLPSSASLFTGSNNSCGRHHPALAHMTNRAPPQPPPRRGTTPLPRFCNTHLRGPPSPLRAGQL
ncbi:hypothetical protein KC19_VG009300 [Ceratodon purpureus]|uniref:Uncharacterized protein n=1 Tax=Ceratodon purpureus TaxID=3225 RepID=A0A8T0HL15_CERPU|nr:hypothetical protein KC19_VG009300 [Ceratodon purpureus]